MLFLRASPVCKKLGLYDSWSGVLSQDEVTLTNDKVIAILEIIINPENLPLFLHCVDGSHVSGLVVCVVPLLICSLSAASQSCLKKLERCYSLLHSSHMYVGQVMCFRKLQSWTLSTSTAEFCKFQREGKISREESQFVEDFHGEIEVPPVIPSWLWQASSYCPSCLSKYRSTYGPAYLTYAPLC